MCDRLNPKQLLQFRDALTEVFTQGTYAAFHDRHWTPLFRNIVGPNDADPIAIGKVLNEANTGCWWRGLLAKARQERPNSKALRDFEIATLDSGRLTQNQIDHFRDLLNVSFTRTAFEDFVAESLELKPGDIIASSNNDLQAIAAVLDYANSTSPPLWRLVLTEARIKRPSDEKLQSFEPEIGPTLPQPPPSYDVVILGSPTGSMVAETSTAIEDLKVRLGKSGVPFTVLPDKWAKKAAHPELLGWASAERKPILILPIDNAWARAYALNPALLKKDIDVAAGAPGSNFKCVIWLPQDTDDDDFVEKINAQSNEGWAVQLAADLFWFQQGNSGQLSQVVERFLGREPSSSEDDEESPPPFGYQDVEYKKMPGGNVIRDIIIPEASAPLGKYKPPTWEEVPFFDEQEAVKIINDMMLYKFGVVAIHNFNDSIDDEGIIPMNFRERVMAIDKIVQSFAKGNGVDPQNILCLGIIATTMPERHSFRYLKKATNEIIARWRFVAVGVKSQLNFQVDSGHLNSLIQELQARLNRTGQRRSE
ncbi:hypothetical protein LB561_09920 [Mesorhizobium sp. B292B1B]|uniref:hypothetical protein n=1 Tax=unclassified Mesorhizobium TaxID=325217 RepID=UPI001129D85B|nr:MULTISPECIES: hypothetical protein [unclassified Mesorhizobium]MCA0012890.1 hypothetical protein [Mesorhizobium sp. B294B1A1]MCA0037609.1 hypothetical protein [Mesorhizobium sp. B292B1B]TPM50714.1 hypothetical protein FJ964_03085 [Mesorhizobium sp. B2-3-2]